MSRWHIGWVPLTLFYLDVQDTCMCALAWMISCLRMSGEAGGEVSSTLVGVACRRLAFHLAWFQPLRFVIPTGYYIRAFRDVGAQGGLGGYEWTHECIAHRSSLGM
ncbi:hypothetical protein GGS24DRAFT_306324 [Hypoxylon argillaceum]|nr:hypothetical protein GGS24DRAFT_306324 [Hypoxylon argillaceum]